MCVWTLCSAPSPGRVIIYRPACLPEAMDYWAEELPLVLVVEPNGDIARLLEAVLRDAGLRAVTAHSVAQARKIVAEDNVQLAVVEIRLPDGNGIALAAELKARGIAIVLMSGHPDAIRQGATAGGVFLAKPFRLREMISAIRMLLPYRNKS